MAKFKYEALQDNIKIVEGELEASSLREARELIRKLGFIPTMVCLQDFQAEPAVEAKEHYSTVKHLTLGQKIRFTSELETILTAGIPILEALETIEKNSPDLKIKIVCKDIKLAIMANSTFAHALEKLYGNVFGLVYTALVKTGEDAGELEATLGRMLILLRKQEAIKDKIVSASIYPAVLLGMLSILFVIFAKLVFPKFAELMKFNGADLPFLAQVIMGTSDFIDQYWWLVIIIICAGCYVAVNLFKKPPVKRCLDKLVLKTPVISDFFTYINLSNFMTIMHISYDAGVSVTSCLELANKTVGNAIIKSKVCSAANMIRGGKPLAEALAQVDVIPHALLSMLSAGEKSGTLGKMFRDCANVIDKKVDMTLEAMTKLFEPAVILIFGGVVFIFVLAFMQAYLGMLGTFY